MYAKFHIIVISCSENFSLEPEMKLVFTQPKRSTSRNFPFPIEKKVKLSP
jgi:hypothetical protein